jgi:hypothetical protein
VLEKAAKEGWSIDKVVEALRNQRMVEARARTIARTEIIRAANQGHRAAAADSPYEVDKKWSAAKDHRTRHSHVLINGHVTDEHGTFKVAIYSGDKLKGYDQMQCPGDPDASAANTVNCRCRTIYIPKRDSAGKLITRRGNTARIIPMRGVTQTIPSHQIAATLKAHIHIGIDGE